MYYTNDRTILGDMMDNLGWNGAVLFYHSGSAGGADVSLRDFAQDFLMTTTTSASGDELGYTRLICSTRAADLAEKSSNGMMILVKAVVDHDAPMWGLDGFDKWDSDAVFITMAAGNNGQVNWIPTSRHSTPWHDVTSQITGLLPPNMDVEFISDDVVGITPLTVVNFPRKEGESGDTWHKRLSYQHFYTVVRPDDGVVCSTRILMDTLGEPDDDGTYTFVVVNPLGFQDTFVTTNVPEYVGGEGTSALGLARTGVIAFNTAENMPGGLIIVRAGQRVSALSLVQSSGGVAVTPIREDQAEQMGLGGQFIPVVLPGGQSSLVRGYDDAGWKQLINTMVNSGLYTDRLESGRKVVLENQRREQVLGSFSTPEYDVTVIRVGRVYTMPGDDVYPPSRLPPEQEWSGIHYLDGQMKIPALQNLW